jgi:hypothetical protein
VTLGEGDRLEARVLSSGDGSAVLKTGDGRIFHAKLDGGASLKPGENVSLVVEDQTDGVITLSIIRENGGQAGRGASVQAALSPEDPATDALTGAPALPDIMARLESLGLPAGEALSGKVLELLRADPALRPDEAIFLAAQDLAYTREALDALRLLLSGDGMLDKMLDQLRTAILETSAPGDGWAAIIENGEFKLIDVAAPTAPDSAPPPAQDTQELLPPSGENAAAESGRSGAPQTETEVAGAPPAAEPAREAASAASPRAEAASLEPAPDNAPAPASSASPLDSPAPQSAAARTDGGAQAGGAGEPASIAREPVRATSGAENAAPEVNADAAPPPSRAASPESSAGERGGVGSELPDASKTGTAGAAHAADNIREAVGDEPPGTTPDHRLAPAGGSISADEFIESLFAKIDGESAGELAGRLRAAISELPERLTRLAESAVRSGAPGAAAIAERADNIVRQARVMNAAEQYVYAQLPVVVSGEKRAAELYVFRRKRSAISPDDANILLSLDLPALGHWEALINVRGHDVSLQMRAAGEDAREHLSGNTARLHEILSEAGYRLTGARVTTGREEEKTTPLTAFAHTRARAAAGIDVVV